MTNSTTGADKPTKSRLWGKSLLILVIIAAFIFLFRMFPLGEWLQAAFGWVKSLGTAGFVMFVGLYIAATVLSFPGSILTLGAGAAYGLVLGSALVIVGATLGATAAFLVGRYVARTAVAKKVEGNRRFAAVDEAVGKHGFKIVFMTRLSPVFPFVLLNYAYGITKIGLRDYVLASFLGMIPGTVLYVYLGKIAAELTTGTASDSSAQTIFTYLGLLITVIVTVYVTKLARKALQSAEVTE
jgi:uncharacterized membrane protein YdjX (TVP38/TMEM64 family)